MKREEGEGAGREGRRGASARDRGGGGGTLREEAGWGRGEAAILGCSQTAGWTGKEPISNGTTFTGTHRD